jgi:hypothetical protein
MSILTQIIYSRGPERVGITCSSTYQAAPMTERPTQRLIPKLLQKYGDIFVNI